MSVCACESDAAPRRISEDLLSVRTCAHEGCLVHPASIWRVGCARPQKLTLRVRRLHYALDQ